MLTLTSDESEILWTEVSSASRNVISRGYKYVKFLYPYHRHIKKSEDISFLVKNSLDPSIYTKGDIIDICNENKTYTHEDKMYVKTLRKQAGICLLNARLNERLKKFDLVEMERQKVFKIFDKINEIERAIKVATPYTVDGICDKYKHAYLMSVCAFDMRTKKPLWSGIREILESYDTLEFDMLFNEFTSFCCGMPEEFIRSLARSPVVKIRWESACNTSSSFFERDAIDYSSDQIQLISWILHYDAIYKNIGPVPDGIVDNDKAFDKWVENKLAALKQERKKYEKDMPGYSPDGTSEKPKPAYELFYPDGTPFVQ